MIIVLSDEVGFVIEETFIPGLGIGKLDVKVPYIMEVKHEFSSLLLYSWEVFKVRASITLARNESQKCYFVEFNVKVNFT